MEAYSTLKEFCFEGTGWEGRVYRGRNGKWGWEVDFDLGNWGFSQDYAAVIHSFDAAERSMRAFVGVTLGDVTLLN